MNVGLIILVGLPLSLMIYVALVTVTRRAEIVRQIAIGPTYHTDYLLTPWIPLLWIIIPALGVIAALLYGHVSFSSLGYLPSVVAILVALGMLLPYAYSKGKQVHWSLLPSWLRALSSAGWRVLLSAIIIPGLPFAYGKIDTGEFIFLGAGCLFIFARIWMEKVPVLQLPVTEPPQYTPFDQKLAKGWLVYLRFDMIAMLTLMAFLVVFFVVVMVQSLR